MTIFVGAVDLCMVLRSVSGSTYTPRALNFGGAVVPDGGIPTGWVTAVDANTGAVRWKYHADTPVVGGVTPTAGGIVMTGDNSGNFLIFDSETGKVLLKNATGGALAGGMVTYARAGWSILGAPVSYASVRYVFGRAGYVWTSIGSQPARIVKIFLAIRAETVLTRVFRIDIAVSHFVYSPHGER